MIPQTQIKTCEKLALHTKIIAETVDHALDKFDAVYADNAMDRVVSIGGLLNVLREQRAKAENLTKQLPSPNQVSAELVEDVAGMGHTLFNFIKQCSKREDELFELIQRAISL